MIGGLYSTKTMDVCNRQEKEGGRKIIKLKKMLCDGYFFFNLLANGAAIQDYLQKKSGQRTVPNIFINQEHIGGCDDLFAAKSSGKLDKLLAA